MIRVVNHRDELEDATSIDRKTKWGNPYPLHKDTTRQEVVEQYLAYAKEKFSRDELLALDGQTLACWCAPFLCHGNALQLLVAEAKGVTRPWVLVSGEAPRRNRPFPPSLMSKYRSIIRERLDQLPRSSVIVHGGAPGIDSLANEYAIEKGLDVVRWPADWQGYGPPAGPKRNQYMLDHAPIDTVICIHRDIRQSVGTKDMLTRAQRERYGWELHQTSDLVVDASTWDGPIAGFGHP